MTEEREKRAVVRSLPRSVLPHPRRPGARVDPFDQWSSYPNLVEAFIDTIAEKAPVSPCDETLASIVSGLLEGTGCAIVRVEPESEKPEGIAVTGTWESANLSDVLGSSGFDWVFALDRAPAVVARQRESMRIREIGRAHV